MTVLEMYHDFRKRFPVLTQGADKIHINRWGSVNEDMVYIWFGSLADAVNNLMENIERDADLALVFSYFEGKLHSSNAEVYKCIDVSFVENLFWQVKPDTAAAVWLKLPASLKQLYLDFHGRPPIQE